MAAFVCQRHGGSDGLSIDIYDFRNCDTNESCILWVEDAARRIIVQTSTATSSFHGSYAEVDPGLRYGVLLFLRFDPTGLQQSSKEFVLMETANHTYVGLDNEGRNMCLSVGLSFWLGILFF